MIYRYIGNSDLLRSIYRSIYIYTQLEYKWCPQNLSWGIERVNLRSSDRIFVFEKHERSVATVSNKKKKILHLGHFAGMKDTFLFFDEDECPVITIHFAH